MPDFKVVATKVLFDHPYAQVVVDTLQHGDHEQSYFYLTSPVEAVATVGLTNRDEIILTSQYRHPIGKVILDLPAGRLNPGESPVDGARREFEEETGYFPNKMISIGYYNQFPGTLRAATNLFFATDLQPTHQQLDEGEELTIVLMPVQVVIEKILTGQFIDGSLQLGVLLAYHKGYLTK